MWTDLTCISIWNFMTMNFMCVRRVCSTHLTCFSINDFRSPLSGLHIRYDSSGPLVPGLGSGSDTLPPVVTSIDQLLDRQWNEGQQFLLQQGSQGDGERLFTQLKHRAVCLCVAWLSLRWSCWGCCWAIGSCQFYWWLMLLFVLLNISLHLC